MGDRGGERSEIEKRESEREREREKKEREREREGQRQREWKEFTEHTCSHPWTNSVAKLACVCVKISLIGWRCFLEDTELPFLRSQGCEIYCTTGIT